jgi:hypothetical protein
MKKASTTLQAVSQKELKRRDFIIKGSQGTAGDFN